jgi:hypothetical protein
LSTIVFFVLACRSEIAQHGCQADTSDNDSRLSLVKLLVCLEDTLKKGTFRLRTVTFLFSCDRVLHHVLFIDSSIVVRISIR